MASTTQNESVQYTEKLKRPRAKKVYKDRATMERDLRKVIASGLTPATGSGPKGWSQETWDRAQSLGITLVGPATYAGQFGSMRALCDTLAKRLGMPMRHAGDVATTDKMIEDLAAYYQAYRAWPEQEAGTGGWNAETRRRALDAGLTLSGPTAYRYWFGRMDDARQLTIQLMTNDDRSNFPIVPVRSKYNFRPSINRRGYLDERARHGKHDRAEHLMAAATAALKEDVPELRVAVEQTNPGAPAKEVAAKVQMPSTLEALGVKPKFVMGALAFLRGREGKVVAIEPVQVFGMRIHISEEGQSFAYDVRARSGETVSNLKPDELFSPDELIDAVASLAELPGPIQDWVPADNPLL